MSTTFEIWRSALSVSDADFALLDTTADGSPFSVLDSPVLPGHRYYYKARALDSVLGYSAFSDIVTGIGPWPVPLGTNMGNNPTTYSGITALLGIGIEPAPGQAVKAARLLELIDCDIDDEHALLESRAIRNHPGVPGMVRGLSKTDGTLNVEATPESLDEILYLTMGSVTTAAAAGPGVPAAPNATVVGAPGAVTASYTLVAFTAQGDSAASPATVVNTLNAVLSANNYVQLSWAAVPYATGYKVLKGGSLLAVVSGLSYADTGGATAAYAAPAAPTGNINTYPLGLTTPTGSLSLFKGTSVFLYGGAYVDKLKIDWDKNASAPFAIAATIKALYALAGYTTTQLGLNTAGFDPLGRFGTAPSCVGYLAGAQADASKFSVEIDRNLGEKQTLNGFTGPSGMYLQGSKHACSTTLYFSSEAEYQRALGQVAPTGPYGLLKSIIPVPVLLVLTLPMNGAGIINQFIVNMPYCNYMTLKKPIKGKEAIMQDIGFYPLIDPVSGTDILMQTVNSRSAAGITTAGTLVTPVPAQAQFNYTN